MTLDVQNNSHSVYTLHSDLAKTRKCHKKRRLNLPIFCVIRLPKLAKTARSAAYGGSTIHFRHHLRNSERRVDDDVLQGLEDRRLSEGNRTCMSVNG